MKILPPSPIFSPTNVYYRIYQCEWCTKLINPTWVLGHCGHYTYSIHYFQAEMTCLWSMKKWLRWSSWKILELKVLSSLILLNKHTPLVKCQKCPPYFPTNPNPICGEQDGQPWQRQRWHWRWIVIRYGICGDFFFHFKFLWTMHVVL